MKSIAPVLLITMFLGLGCQKEQTQPKPATEPFHQENDQIKIKLSPLPVRTDPPSSTRRPRQTSESQAQSLRQCPTFSKPVHIMGIGSSTMASWLGPALRKQLKNKPVKFTKHGVASSGLARPDFYNWPKELNKLIKRKKPDMFVVAMGTNDFQSMRKGRKWIRFPKPEWNKTYAERVDQMLLTMSGPLRNRPVIWVGPTAFKRPNSRRFGPHISAIIRERIKKFVGPVYFIDAFAATSGKDHRPLRRIQDPVNKRFVKVLGGDNVHLTHKATRIVMTDPVMQYLLKCGVIESL